jgi:hypothetical protein
MAIVFHRDLALPLSAAAFGAVALSTRPRVLPSLLALAGIAVIAAVIPAIVRRARAPQHDDAAGLVRMEDDGGQPARRPAGDDGSAHTQQHQLP